jgi:hypothetical protein
MVLGEKHLNSKRIHSDASIQVEFRCESTTWVYSTFYHWFSNFLSFFHKKEPAFYKYLDDITKNGKDDGLHSIKMPKSTDIEDNIYLGYALLQNRKKRLADKSDCSWDQVIQHCSKSYL